MVFCRQITELLHGFLVGKAIRKIHIFNLEQLVLFWGGFQGNVSASKKGTT